MDQLNSRISDIITNMKAAVEMFTMGFNVVTLGFPDKAIQQTKKNKTWVY